MSNKSLLIVITLGIVLSCSSLQNAPDSNSGEVSNVKGLAESNDSLFMDQTKGPLGELYNSDTLILKAWYSECGEFGGHREFLKIFSEDSIWMCQTIYDSVVCGTSANPMHYIRTDSSLYKINRSIQQSIISYLTELTRLRFQFQDRYGHTGNMFSAVVHSTIYWEPFDTTYMLHWYDQSHNWNKFQELKRDIQLNN